MIALDAGLVILSTAKDLRPKAAIKVHYDAGCPPRQTHEYLEVRCENCRILLIDD